MRTLPFVLLLAVAGCSRGAGPSADPRERMFEAGYERFISAAKAHKGGCEISLSAKGDGGSNRDGFESRLEVDDEGSYRLTVDGFELVRVGSVSWQKDAAGAWKRVESGARPDLQRDDAIAGWRDVLLPMRERLTLTRTGRAELGTRDVDAYDVVAEPGGGADGGVQVIEGKGRVALDEETGFPVSLTFEGSWEGPATPPGEGRVTWTVEKMECAVTEMGGVPAITPAIAPATPTPAPTEAATAKPAAPATPKASPAKKPAPGRG